MNKMISGYFGGDKFDIHKDVQIIADLFPINTKFIMDGVLSNSSQT